MRTLKLSIIPIIFIISCNSKPIKLELIPEIKDVVIPITSDQLSSYQVLSNYSDDGTEKLIAYNGSKHSLDYFDLDNSKVLKSENLFFLKGQMVLEQLNQFTGIIQIRFLLMNEEKFMF